MTHKLFTAVLLLVSSIITVSVGHISGARHVLDEVPLIDGHNDFPYNIFSLEHNNLDNFDFTQNLTNNPKWGSCTSCYTDLPKLRKGKVGAQFWVAYVACNTQYRDAVSKTLEQIDVIKRLVKKYPKDLQFVTDSDGIMDAFRQGKIASMIGVEGGHSMDARVGVLRMLYELGARYMTLTHTCQTPWADSSFVDIKEPIHNLTEFGRALVREMNRMGMMVDLSHVSHNVMNQAISESRAPVIFSHSSAWEVFNHHRNVHDDTLKMVQMNNGIVMVNFYPDFITATPEKATIHDVMKHINHIAKVAGHDHVGLGGDYDGVNRMPKGLENVSKYPNLLDALALEQPTVWTHENLAKLAGGNLIRVFKDVELVRDQLEDEEPLQDWISKEDLLKVEELNLLKQCRTFFDDEELVKKP
ncbi:dipeptidase 1-like isoform X3 [Atheta coriaria]|uniref:dipeptidase 1-like isoform X3 n=1 Tax=Dalotia coriaria TaxID=877792 RepID=UPI0031F3CAF0